MNVIERGEIGGEFSLILLAAGSSARMGQSKQLLLLNDEPLLLRSAKAALDSLFKNVIIVLGAEEERHRSVISHLPVQVIHNQAWAKGMGSSIKKGLTHLLNIQPDLDAVVIMVCDQPLLTSAHLNEIIGIYKKTKKNIVASYYSNALGVPALFDKSLFHELSTIPDEQGAKKILTKYSSNIAAVDFPGGEIDLDTWEEYQNFKNKSL